MNKAYQFAKDLIEFKSITDQRRKAMLKHIEDIAYLAAGLKDELNSLAIEAGAIEPDIEPWRCLGRREFLISVIYTALKIDKNYIVLIYKGIKVRFALDKYSVAINRMALFLKNTISRIAIIELFRNMAYECWKDEQFEENKQDKKAIKEDPLKSNLSAEEVRKKMSTLKSEDLAITIDGTKYNVFKPKNKKEPKQKPNRKRAIDL